MSMGIPTGLSTPMSNRKVPTQGVPIGDVPIVDRVGDFGFRARSHPITDYFEGPSGTVEDVKKLDLTRGAGGDPQDEKKGLAQLTDEDYEIMERPPPPASKTGKSEARIASESFPEKTIKPLTESTPLPPLSADTVKPDQRNRQMGEESGDPHPLKSSSVRSDSLHDLDDIHPVAKGTILFLTVFQQLFENSKNPVPFITLFHIFFMTPMLMRMGLR
ncbi:uncharacterized protein PGTG_14872 [Puccinia graminis f. sp. tritici CRL 75-36-700-3]|uniref:Uncharacterized protein n=1 Tax=Puccinia graminis f. sp. tritici (strain CRL 75-36-700-3 / race SCCL) TaxID=418459 RepID=E3KXU5_PUCGT|nr:uncharacterized protein PGTG_14872 [Puccinia graminis f. sp. tritici CRL 75-36-700-3]EFP89031.1 hypothetical protein PGTG_14872 [Puccinia graminis f. sp. tritici CRL 75-36-700-3]